MNDPIVIEKEIPRIDEKLVIPEWVEIYSVCKPRATQASGMQFHDPDALLILKRMLTQIVEAEGPLHKDVAANEPMPSFTMCCKAFATVGAERGSCLAVAGIVMIGLR